MRSSAATDEYARAETDPLITFHITDLQHQRSSSGVLTLGFSQITRGAGFTARGCPVAPPKRGPGPAPRRALRLDDPLVATPLIAGSERTHLLDERVFNPMHEPAVVCMVIRVGYGVERTRWAKTVSASLLDARRVEVT